MNVKVRRALTMALSMAMLVSACQAGPPGTPPGSAARTDPPLGPDLVEPAVQTSANGILQASLTPALSTTTVGGQEVTTTVYNGSFPGPTLACARATSCGSNWPTSWTA